MTSLAIRECGDPRCPSVVLLHGVRNDGSMWTNLMAGLRDHHYLAPASLSADDGSAVGTAQGGRRAS